MYGTVSQECFECPHWTSKKLFDLKGKTGAREKESTKRGILE